MAAAPPRSPRVPQSQSRQQKTIVGISQQKVHTIYYTWIIKNFKHVKLDKTGDEILSPEFEDPITHETRWRLEMANYKNVAISFFVRLMSSKKPHLHVKCKLSIVAKNVQKVQPDYVETRSLKENGAVGINIRNIHSSSALKIFKQPKHLKIKCSIFLIGDITNIDMDCDWLNVPDQGLSKDYERLLSDTSTSDIVLSLGNTEIKCHKAVLTARSPVFAAMLRHDFKEKKTNKIKIEGMEQNVLEEIIWFMYTGTVKHVDQISGQLLEAANQYALERLRGICEKHLVQGLSVENAVDVLLCADRTSSERLKLQAKRFINHNLKQIIKTKSWAFLMTSNKSLFNEVLQ